MIKDIRHTIYMLMLLIFCVACDDQDITTGDENTSGKDPIVLSASNISSTGNAPTTRGIIDGQAKETAFEKHTRLTLLMVSENDPTNPTETKYTVTYGLAKGSGKNAASWNDTDGFSAISFATTQTPETSTQVYTDPTGASLESSKTNTYGDGSIRYWNDAHERKSVLSIYGFAINSTILPAGALWQQKINGIENTAGRNFEAFTSLDYTIKSNLSDGKWRVGNHNLDATNYSVQNYISLLYKDDLLYSNNLSNQGGSDGRLNFNQSSKQFDKDKVLQFKHAMTMLSFKIKPGAGFDKTKSDNFNFKGGTNIALRGFYKKGNLNIKTGEWENKEVENNVNVESKYYNWRTIANVTNGKNIATADNHEYYLLALVIPGTDLTTANVDDAVTIIIDDNEYTISMRELYNAIHEVSANNDTQNETKVDDSVLEDGTKLKAGNNYEFTITIAKTAVSSIEARLVPWEKAIAIAKAYNTHVKLSLTDSQGAAVTNSEFSLYRAEGTTYGGTDYNGYADYNWEKGYSDPATTNETGTSGVYSTNWHWPDNKTFYHFRTIFPISESILGNDATSYITLSGGSIAGGSPIWTDYQWGAPFNSGSSLAYSHTSGFCNNEDKAQGQIYKAIGATDNTIAITQLHMTSQVFVDLDTSTGDDKVNHTGATVTLTNLATTANLQLGNGLVTGHTGYANVQITSDAHAASNPIPAYDYSYVVIPQKLTGNGNTTGVGNASGTVGIKIKLTDGNEYFIEDLSSIQGTPSGEIKQDVTTWDPGKRYYYKFKLTKTGIDPLTATIVNWEIVEATYDDVQIQ